ncbi:MAG: T9SS type A sorting domain-containing protein [Bacteroidota bacterium]
MRDAQNRDTARLIYEFSNGQRFLKRKNVFAFRADGTRDSTSTLSYYTAPPHDLFITVSRKYNEDDQEIGLTRYFFSPNDGLYKLRDYRTHVWQDSFLVYSDEYRDFAGQLDSLIQTQEVRYSYLPGNTSFATKVQSTRLHPDSSLALSDSTFRTFDAQNRRSSVAFFRWEANMWDPIYTDSLTYPSPESAISFLSRYQSGVLTPSSKTVSLFTGDTFLRTIESWDTTCQCYWRSFVDSLVFGPSNRWESRLTLDMETPTDTSSLFTYQYSYYGVHRFLRYSRSEFTFFGASPFQSITSSTYSLTDSILSNTPDPIAFEVEIYPNPSTGMINLRYPVGESGRLRILRSDGRIVRQESVSGIGRWQGDLSDLPAGLYFIQLQLGEQQVSKALLLQR